MRVILSVLAALALFASTDALAQQTEPRLALVFGNADYNLDHTTSTLPDDSARAGNPPDLRTPPNDADAMEAALTGLHFEVIKRKDADLATMKAALQAFGARLRALGPTAIAFVYFSGHAVQMDGVNLLLPAGIKVNFDEIDRLSPPLRRLRLQELSISFADIYAQLREPDPDVGVNVIVLDACRDNPWGERVGGASGLRQALPTLGSTLVAFSTDPNATASDGGDDASNSPYTAALVAQLSRSSESRATLTTVFTDVNRDVASTTRGKQRPWTNVGALPIICLATCPAVGASVPLVSVSYEDCPGCPRMVQVGGSNFYMGSPGGVRGEPGRDAQREGSQRWVRIDTFSIGLYEVTFDQYAVCMRAGKCKTPDPFPWNEGRHPVVGVSWRDAQDYVAWLSGETHHEYRLPSESEWEYAARGGSVGRYSNGGGEAELCAIANHADRSSPPSTYRNTACDDHVAMGTAEVGPPFEKNPIGLYDVHGNAWEWVQDCFTTVQRDRPTTGVAYRGDDQTCAQRVDRGGGWNSGPIGLRSADRGYAAPDERQGDIGFRVARGR